MAYQQRITIINKIQRLRNSKVITCFLSDRPTDAPQQLGLSLSLGTDIQPVIYDHLQAMGKVENLDLFLYTRGGNTDVVWPLVNILRQYCNKLKICLVAILLLERVLNITKAKIKNMIAKEYASRMFSRWRSIILPHFSGKYSHIIIVDN